MLRNVYKEYEELIQYGHDRPNLTEKKVEEQLLQKINTRTRGAFDLFLIEHNLCPLCLNDLNMRTGEKCCTSCGYVSNSFVFNSNIPLKETRAPENQLAFGKGLGNTLGKKGLFCVLARSTGTQDLPIRARQISIITQKLEHPKIMTLKRLGRKRSHEWGFGEHHRKQSVIFSDYFGKMLSRVGAYLILNDSRISTSKIVDGCLALALRAVKSEQAYEEAIEKLHLDRRFLESLQFINSHVTESF